MATSAVGQFGRLAAQFATASARSRCCSPAAAAAAAGELNRWTSQGLAWLAENRGQVAAQVAGEAGIVVELFAGLALAVFCALFFLHSGERLLGVGAGGAAGAAAGGTPRAAGWTAFAGYTRGVVLVAVSNATFVGIALHLLKVRWRCLSACSCCSARSCR